MAILERFRSRNRSVASDGASDSGSTAGSAKSNKSTTLPKLIKTFSWRGRSDSTSNNSANSSSNDDESSSGIGNTNDRPEKGVPSWLKKNKKPKKKKGDADFKDKPLTIENLEHQEMLSQFTWTFHNRASIDGRSIVSGISPGNSRRPSMSSRANSYNFPDMGNGANSQPNGQRQPHPLSQQQHGNFLSPGSATRRPGVSHGD